MDPRIKPDRPCQLPLCDHLLFQVLLIGLDYRRDLIVLRLPVVCKQNAEKLFRLMVLFRVAQHFGWQTINKPYNMTKSKKTKFFAYAKQNLNMADLSFLRLWDTLTWHH